MSVATQTPAPTSARPSFPVDRNGGHQTLMAAYDVRETEPETPSAAPAAVPAAAGGPGSSPPPAAAYEHPEAVVEMARDFGWSEDEIRATEPQQLRAIMRGQRRELLAARAARQEEARTAATFEQARTQTPNAQPPVSGASPVGPGAPATGSPPAAQVPPAEDGFDLGINEADYDPGIVGALKRIAAHATAKITALEATVAQLRQAEVGRQNETKVQMLDRLFAAQNNDAVFGTGPGQSLDAKGPHLARRVAVITAMQHAAGNTFEEKFANAAKTLFGGIAAPSTPAPAAAANPYGAPAAAPPATPKPSRVLPPRTADGRFTAEEWEAAALVTPTHRSGAGEPPGDAKARATVANYLRESGVTEGGGDDGDELDGFL